MLNLDATDNFEGLASVTNVVEFTFSGVDGTTVVSKEGKLTTSQTTIHTAAGIVRGYGLTLYNSHSAAVTVTISKDPTDAGTLYRLFSISLGIGYTALFDGSKLSVMDALGGLVSGVNVSDTTYAATWDGVTTIAPSKNAIYDQLELKAPLISPALVTPALGTPASGVLTNCTGLPTAGLATQVFAAGIGIGGAAAQTGGIAFPATAVPSADPNTLDDYEEGEFGGAGANEIVVAVTGTITCANVYICTYTKKGREVSVSGVAVVSAVSGQSGQTSIILPFAAGTGNSFAGAGSIQTNGVDFTGNYLSLRVDPANARAKIVEVVDNAGATILGAAGVAVTDEIYIGLTYFTD